MEAVKILEVDIVRAKPLCSPFLKLWYKGTGERNNKEKKMGPMLLTEYGVLSQAPADFLGN